MKKRIISLLLAVTMVVSLTACSNQGKSNQTSSSSVASELEGKEPNEWGWVKPEETLTISVYAGYGDQEEFLADEAGGKATYDKWLLDNMNVKIDWNYYSVDMNEKLNLMLASGDYPEVITWMSDDMANKFIEQGKAIDLTDMIEKYGNNITRRLGDYINFLKDENGKIYKLAQYWGMNPNVAGADFGVRHDLWKELGEDIYSTPEEYFDTMVKLLSKNKTNANGQTTYAFSSTDKGLNLLNCMLGTYGFVNGYKNDNGTFTHWLNTEEGLEIAKFMNKAYRNNLIDPDYLTNGYEEYITKLSSGQLLGNLGTWWHAWVGGHQNWAVNEGDAYDINKRFMNVSVAAEGVPLDKTTLITSNYVGNYRLIITDKCKNPEMVMRWLNWENSELGNFITGWGAPSEDNVWNIAEDGTWKMIDSIMDVDRKDETYHPIKEKNGAGIYMLASNCNWLFSDGRSDFSKLDPRVDRVSVYDYWPVTEDGEFANEGVNICWQYYKAPVFDVTLYNTPFSSEDNITIVKQTITDNITAEWAKMVTAPSEAECEKLFYEARDNNNKIGLKDLTAYYQAAYAKNLATFSGK